MRVKKKNVKMRVKRKKRALVRNKKEIERQL